MVTNTVVSLHNREKNVQTTKLGSNENKRTCMLRLTPKNITIFKTWKLMTSVNVKIHFVPWHERSKTYDILLWQSMNSWS